MPKPWKEVIQSDGYKQLTYNEKKMAQDAYFDEVVAPKIQGEQVFEARKQFYGEYPVQMQPAKMDAPSPVKGLGEKLESGVRSLIPKDFRETNIDYTSGLPDASFRAGFSRMDTPEERESYLGKNIGQKGDMWDRDQYGAYILKPKGALKFGIKTNKPLAIDERGFSKYDIADFAGDAPAIAGGTGAAIASTGLGVIPGAAITALGGMTGKLIDEGVESFQGYNLQTPLQVAQDVGMEGIYAGGGELGARSLMPIGRKLLGPHTTKKLDLVGKQSQLDNTIDPKRIELANEAYKIGAKPSVQQASDKKLIGRMQGMMDNIFGSDRTIANRNALLKEKNRLLSDAAGEHAKKYSTFSTMKVGKVTADKIQGELTKRGSAYEIAKTHVDNAINKARSVASKSLGKKVDDIGARTTDDILNSRDVLRKQSSDLYREADEFYGNQAVVPTRRLQDIAKTINKEIMKTKDGQLVFVDPGMKKQLGNVTDLPEYVTFQEMHGTRTYLNDSIGNDNLMAGVSDRWKRMLAKASNDTFKDVDDIVTPDKTPIVTDWQQPKPSVINTDRQKIGVAKRKLADQFYSEHITKYDDMLIKRIARDPGLAGKIDPSDVMRMATKSKENAMRVKNVVSEDVWSKVSRAHFDDLTNSSMDVSGQINGEQLYKKVRQLNNDGTLHAVYGDKANDILKLSKEMAAKNGKINLAKLDASSNVVVALKESAKRQADYDSIAENVFLKDLQKEGVEYERAVDFIFRPGHTRHIAAAKEFFGEQSKEWHMIRQKAMKNILDSFIDSTSDPVDIVLNGQNMRKAIAKYGDDTLQEMFGKDLADDLSRFAQVAHFLTTKNNLSGGIVAANIALHPVKKLPKLIQLRIWSKFLDSKNGVKYFTEGIRAADTKAGAAARGAAKMSVPMTKALMQFAAIAEDETGQTWESIVKNDGRISDQPLPIDTKEVSMRNRLP